MSDDSRISDERLAKLIELESGTINQERHDDERLAAFIELRELRAAAPELREALHDMMGAIQAVLAELEPSTSIPMLVGLRLSAAREFARGILNEEAKRIGE